MDKNVQRSDNNSNLENPSLEASHFFNQDRKDYAIFIIDPKGNISSWNRDADSFYGYTEEEIIGQGLDKFYPDLEGEKRSSKLNYRLEEASIKGYHEEEGWQIREDGKIFWVNSIISPLYDNHHRLIGYNNIARDFTVKKHMEEESRRGLEAFRLMIEAVKDYAIFMLDSRGHIKTWNRGAQLLKGYTAEEIVGKHFSHFYPQEDIDAGKPEWELREAIRFGRFEDEDWRLRKDGSRFWANVIITPVYRDNDLIGFTKVTRDLTERKRLENELQEARNNLEKEVISTTASLRETQERLSLALEAAHMGIFDWDVSQMRATWSESMQRLWGFVKDENPISLEKMKSHMHPEDLPRFEKAAQAAFSGSGEYDFEYRVIWPDKTLHWINARGRGIRDSKGNIVRFLGTAVEITSRKMREEKERMLAQTSMIFSSSLDFEKNIKTVADIVVPSFASGMIIYKINERGGKNFSIYHPDLIKDPLAKKMEIFLQTLADHKENLQAFHKKQTILFTRSHLTEEQQKNLNSNDAEILSLTKELGITSYAMASLNVRSKMFGGIIFITDRHKHALTNADKIFVDQFAFRVASAMDNAGLYQSAQEAIRVREDIVSIVSHDLKNPLSIILMNSSLLMKKMTIPESIRAKLDRIERAAGRMKRMIEDLLDVSKLEAGTFTVELHEEDVSTILEESVDMHSFLASEKNISISLKPLDNDLVVNCDHQRIMQVFSNLIGNAIKFTPPGGSIALQAIDRGHFVEFCVRDTGPGIPDHQLDCIFERYWQAQETKKMGAGLGLFIAKGIVDAHRGKIWVENNENGASFYFTLPL